MLKNSSKRVDGLWNTFLVVFNSEAPKIVDNSDALEDGGLIWNSGLSG